MIKRRRLTEQHDLLYWSQREDAAREVDGNLQALANQLIAYGATAAARAVQRARKSVQGAQRHAHAQYWRAWRRDNEVGPKESRMP